MYRVLDNVTFIEAHPQNFNPSPRYNSSIHYIVIHYTSNKGDTARNNALYFRENAVSSSAHFFVSGTSIYQSVPENHAAYAVGLGRMKVPYFKWPEMWKKITNGNSISIEICGYPDSTEGDDQTKNTAAMLAADLIEKYNLGIDKVYRHYDVTGKPCPKWAVDDPNKWQEFKSLVYHHLYRREDDDLKDTPENYSVFKKFMAQYLSERDTITADWEEAVMMEMQQKGVMDGTRPKAWVTRGELATVIDRIEK